MQWYSTVPSLLHINSYTDPQISMYIQNCTVHSTHLLLILDTVSVSPFNKSALTCEYSIYTGGGPSNALHGRWKNDVRSRRSRKILPIVHPTSKFGTFCWKKMKKKIIKHFTSFTSFTPQKCQQSIVDEKLFPLKVQLNKTFFKTEVIFAGLC